MADIIDILPDHVANQIAAGEVIQRPASIVKELLENAVDAGASQIHLQIKDAGRTLVQVTDNGCGMSLSDSRRCFERHATSKIKAANDIFSIRTKGFRGEALASIAAVAQVDMITKRPDDEIGSHVVIEGSDPVNHEPTGCQDGTRIQVKNLFYNIPARRNFLKSNPVETRHIMDEFHRVAIAHPGISFGFHHNENEVYQLPAGPLRQRLVGLFGKNFNQRLVPLEETTDLATITGFIGKPEFARKTRGEQFFFVNNRFIKSSYLHHAVQSAYTDLIQRDAHPSYFIFLEVDPNTIDINIHPTKTEIKFEDEKALYAILQSTVKRSLGQYNISPALDFEQESAFSHLPPPTPGQKVSAPEVKVDKDYNPFRAKTEKHGPSVEDAMRFTQAMFREDAGEAEEAQEEQHIISPEWNNTQDSSSTKVRAQLHNTFILTQVKSGVMIIDQQLAHERILFERFLDQLELHQGQSQQLLFPENVELSREDYDILMEIEDDVKALGFDLAHFGKHSVVVHGMPADLGPGEPKEQIESLVEQYKNNRSRFSLPKRENLARSLARNASVKAGKALGSEEMDNLIDGLFACRQPYVSPDGRPTVTTLTLDSIRQIFKSR
ncbi:MAG: DNA mismatch repair endonuclease MutL [Flavobacteriales bacterium]|nr:DNA mismatch repair endonuclease MutL [Flavobacteriales bacterium]